VLLSFIASWQSAIASDLRSLRDTITPENLTITYTIHTEGDNDEDIAETYNGGKKTIFVNGENVRVRLVSLMRTQSIFFNPAMKSGQKTAAVIKESGRDKHKFLLTKEQWTTYNGKYNGATCTPTGDSIQILDYMCKEAMITLVDGRTVKVYYTDTIIQPSLSLAEPVFSCVPGTVLQYEYIHRRGRIVYTAEDVSMQAIDKEVFDIPAKGYTLRQYKAR
jgi:hypothetical protein